MPLLLHFQRAWLEIISNRVVKMRVSAISNVQLSHPLRGTAYAEHRRLDPGRRGSGWRQREQKARTRHHGYPGHAV
jgi:hypothetical protein